MGEMGWGWGEGGGRALRVACAPHRTRGSWASGTTAAAAVDVRGGVGEVGGRALSSCVYSLRQQRSGNSRFVHNAHYHN